MLGAHDDPLAVRGDHQHVAVFGGGVLAGGVEVLDVGCGPGGQLLGLAFGHRHARVSVDRFDGIVERASGRLDGSQAAQTMRVAFFGQVQ